ncbi:MAG: ATP-binding protein, partial [bacterium]
SRDFAGKPTLGVDFGIYAKDGTIHTVLFSPGGVILQEEETKPNLLITGIDITDRKKTEEALRRTQFSVDKAADIVLWITSDGKIRYANDQACRVLGYSRQELLSMFIYNIDVNFPSKVWKKQWQEMKQLGLFTFESAYRNKSSRIFPVEISLNFMEFGGVDYGCAFVRDITERKEIEKMKDNLIRDASHSLKTPVAMIEMAHDMFLRGCEVGDENRIEKAQNIITHNLRIMHKDIDNILSMGQAVKEKKKSISLKAIINDIVEDIRPFAEQKKNRLTIKITPGANKIVAVRKEIWTLIYNILDNAIKFTEQGNITLSGLARKGWIEIKCKDTGYGIAPKDMDKVFEKFFKRHPAIEGTGLGLPICKDIVHRNGGTIKVLSKGEGRGTTVLIRLPKKGGQNGRGKK